MKDPLVTAFIVILVAFIVTGTATTIYNLLTFLKRSDEGGQRRGLPR